MPVVGPFFTVTFADFVAFVAIRRSPHLLDAARFPIHHTFRTLICHYTSYTFTTFPQFTFGRSFTLRPAPRSATIHRFLIRLPDSLILRTSFTFDCLDSCCAVPCTFTHILRFAHVVRSRTRTPTHRRYTLLHLCLRTRTRCHCPLRTYAFVPHTCYRPRGFTSVYAHYLVHHCVASHLPSPPPHLRCLPEFTAHYTLDATLRHTHCLRLISGRVATWHTRTFALGITAVPAAITAVVYTRCHRFGRIRYVTLRRDVRCALLHHCVCTSVPAAVHLAPCYTAATRTTYGLPTTRLPALPPAFLTFTTTPCLADRYAPPTTTHHHTCLLPA